MALASGRRSYRYVYLPRPKPPDGIELGSGNISGSCQNIDVWNYHLLAKLPEAWQLDSSINIPVLVYWARALVGLIFGANHRMGLLL